MGRDARKYSPLTPHGRVTLARFTREDRAYGASRLLKTSKNDCFAVYSPFKKIMVHPVQSQSFFNL